MNKSLSALVLAVVAVLSAAPELRAQAPDPGAVSPEKYSVKILKGQKVAMRDGVELCFNLYLPEGSEPAPAILTHTPYDRAGSLWADRAPWFVRRGYAYVISDTRGRNDSGGEWDPFDPRHKTDG